MHVPTQRQHRLIMFCVPSAPSHIAYYLKASFSMNEISEFPCFWTFSNRVKFNVTMRSFESSSLPFVPIMLSKTASAQTGLVLINLSMAMFFSPSPSQTSLCLGITKVLSLLGSYIIKYQNEFGVKMCQLSVRNISKMSCHLSAVIEELPLMV